MSQKKRKQTSFRKFSLIIIPRFRKELKIYKKANLKIQINK